MARDEDTAAFWRYAVAVYSRPGVSERCLYLQDEHGVDVNILLFVAWLAADKGRALTEEDSRRLIEGTAAWRRDVVQAIRAVRRRVKPLSLEDPALDPVYQALKRTELDAERAQHRMLLALADGLGRPDEAATALANMRGYLSAHGVEAAGEAERAVSAISRLASS